MRGRDGGGDDRATQRHDAAATSAAAAGSATTTAAEKFDASRREIALRKVDDRLLRSLLAGAALLIFAPALYICAGTMSFHTKPTGPQPLLDRETLAERADAMLLPQASSLASAYRAWRERAQRARPVADADEHDATAQGAAWLVAVDEEFESYVVHPGDRDGEEPRFACSLRKALRFVGPSWVVMVPYVQPLEAAELGAYTGHALLWLLLLTALVRLGLQEAAARVGVVSGRGLAHAAASSLGYPRWVRGVLFSGLTLAVVGASVRSLIAGATALHTLSAGQLPPMAGSAIVAADALVLLGLHDLGVRGFEAAVGAAFATGAICAIITAPPPRPRPPTSSSASSSRASHRTPSRRRCRRSVARRRRTSSSSTPPPC